MREKEFTNIFIEKIKLVLKFAAQNKYSDFYSRRSLPLKISNYQEFQNIPFLTKDEILGTQLKDRTFVKESEITSFNLTSGTTKRGRILAIPLTNFEKPGSRPYSMNSLDIKNKKCLVLFPSMSAAFTAYISGGANRGGIIIPGDITNLKKTALVTKELKPEIIITTPTILDFFLRELEEINFETSIIKNISLGGENTSTLKDSFFKSKFPKAKILYRYGASETGGLRGYRCEHLKDKTPDTYHPGEVFIEIINQDGEILPDGEVGEIVHTDLISPKGFPFIRYKTGDIGSIQYKECPCGNNRIIKLGGRANYDVLKFSGITLYSEQIEISLSKFSDKIQPTFEMHVYEEEYNNKILPKLVLKLALDNNPGVITAKIIETQVTENLQLSANKNLKYFVDNEIFLPLEVVFVDIKELNSTKRSGIVSHL